MMKALDIPPIQAVRDLACLPSVPFKALSQLPNGRGIYFVIGPNEAVLYVGRSVGSIRSRWKNHHRIDDARAAGAVRIAWLIVSKKANIPSLEGRCIRALRPALNGNQGSADPPVPTGRLHESAPTLSRPAGKPRIVPRPRNAYPARYFTVRQLAASMNVSASVILERIRSGRLPAIDVSLTSSKRPMFVFNADGIERHLPASWWKRRMNRR